MTVTPAAGLPPALSIVIPAYNEAENVEALYRRVTAAAERAALPFEVLVMDNDSTDGTGRLVKQIVAADRRWRYVRLSRNFGYQINITAGVGYARGEAIVVMDADLQDPPELIPEFVAWWRQGYDVVYGVRGDRLGEPRWRRSAMRLYYRLLNSLSPLELPLDAGDFRLISRRVQREFLKFPESSRYLRGLFAYIGYRQKGVPYRRQARHGGESKFPFWRLVALALDGVVSFSMVPLRLLSLVGTLVVLAGVGYLGFVLYERLFRQPPAGWTTVIIVMLVLGGLQILFLGLIGEYVGRTYMDAKRRPLWIVAEQCNVGAGVPPALPEAGAEWVPPRLGVLEEALEPTPAPAVGGPS
ncbi:MAG: glycosyltransferase family 2 protein [Chloroflexi bacterium]|nr:glycosyltransferase family 2 protein [Chloroflexota bacterium]